MKEISAVTLDTKAYLAGSAKCSTKKAGTSFDSYLDIGANKTGAVQPATAKTQQKAEAAQQNANAVQAGQNKAQARADGTQPDQVQAEDQVQADGTQPQDGKVQEQDTQAGTDQADGTVSGVQAENQAVTVEEAGTDTADTISGIEEMAALLTGMIRDIVKNVTGMDDGMLNNALQALGMTEADLLDTGNLKELVLFINGSSDATDLLANEYMMSQLNDISDAIADINLEELTEMPEKDFLAMLKNMLDGAAQTTEKGNLEENPADNFNAGQTGTDILKDDIPVTIDYERESAVTAQKTGPGEVLAGAGDTARQADKGTDPGRQEGLLDNGKNQDNLQGTGTNQAESFKQGTDSQAGSTMPENTQTEAKTPVHNEVLNGTAGFLQNIVQAAADVTGTTATQQSNMQQMIDIVNQVVEQIKVTLGKDTTTMQMQLNPESLGKVLVSVSSNHGVMTANFTVQTEEAREALESQIYHLREALESRSLKVDAVEVEVSDFAFSQSNQADTQDGKEFGKGSGKRFRFGFENSADEEETVSTIQQNRQPARPGLGSSIDFTA